MITDNEEFYKKEKSISLQNVKELFNILKEELWQLLWVIPSYRSWESYSLCIKSKKNSVTIYWRGIQHVRNWTLGTFAWLELWVTICITTWFSFSRCSWGKILLCSRWKWKFNSLWVSETSTILSAIYKQGSIYTSQLVSARQQNNSSHTEPFIQHQIQIRHN
jgi:hypothetical protein